MRMRHQRMSCPGRSGQQGGTTLRLGHSGGASHKINANNQLRLAPAVSFDLGCWSRVCGSRQVLARGRAVASGAASIAWRASGDWRAALHWWKLRGVTGDGGCSSVDGWRAADHLRGRSSSLSCRAWEDRCQSGELGGWGGRFGCMQGVYMNGGPGWVGLGWSGRVGFDG